MNRKSLAAALVLVASAGSVLAEDITIDNTPFTSAKSRAEVQAELQQFRASRIDPWGQDYDQLASFRSERTRQEVTDEYVGERDTVNAFNGEDSGSMYMARRDVPMPSTHLAAVPADAE